MSQLTLYNAPTPLPDRPQLRQERHPCSNQNQRSSSPVVGGLFTDPRSSSAPPEDAAPDGNGTQLRNRSRNRLLASVLQISARQAQKRMNSGAAVGPRKLSGPVGLLGNRHALK